MCSGHLLLVSPGYYLLKCTGDTNFGVRIGTNLGHQIWCPGDTIFYSVQIQSCHVCYNNIAAVDRLCSEERDLIALYCSCMKSACATNHTE